MSEIADHQLSKTYLGDAVYAEFDGWHIVLTTENGIEATNTIYLEPDVVSKLTRFIEDLNANIATARSLSARPPSAPDANS